MAEEIKIQAPLSKVQAKKLKAGDKVLLGKYSGSEVNLGKEEYMVVREDDILAKIN